MTHGVFNGRLRRHSSYTVSLLPQHLPSGLLTVHRVDRIESSCPSTKCVDEVISTGRGIVDHAWTLMSTVETLGNSEGYRLLAVLTRESPRVSDTPVDREHSPSRGIVSKVRLFRAMSFGRLAPDRVNDESFESRGWTLVRTLEFAYMVTGVTIDRGLLIMAHSSGAWVYHLESMLSEGRDRRPPTELIRSYGVHALQVSDPFFAAVSGNRLGIWELRKIHNTCPPAVWSTSLAEHQERPTSITMADEGRLIAVAFWDGAVTVFQKTAIDEPPIWDVMGKSPPWADCTESKGAKFPTHVAFSHSTRKGWRNDVMAVSTPGSGLIRCFDLETEERLDDIVLQCTSQVHGMVTLSDEHLEDSAGLLVWVDAQDILHRRPWPRRNVSILLPFLPPKRYDFPLNCYGDGAASATRGPKEVHWSIEFQWPSTASETVGIPLRVGPLLFLSDEHVVELVRRTDSPGSFRTLSFACLCSGYFLLFIEFLHCIFVYSCEKQGWRSFYQPRLQNETETKIAFHAKFHESRWLFVISTTSANASSPLELTAWDLEDAACLGVRSELLPDHYQLEPDALKSFCSCAIIGDADKCTVALPVGVGTDLGWLFWCIPTRTNIGECSKPFLPAFLNTGKMMPSCMEWLNVQQDGANSLILMFRIHKVDWEYSTSVEHWRLARQRRQVETL